MNIEKETGYCICVKCGTKVLHKQGVPCRTSKCPNCGKTMLREGNYHHQLYLHKQNENSSSNKK